MLSPCLAPRCGELVQGETYCRRHAKRAKVAERGPRLMPCLAGGCPTLIAGGGYCPRHRDRGPAPRTGPSPWRTGRWRDVATRYLREHPRCEFPDCTELATLVHHIAGDGRLGNHADLSDSNLESLCAQHHGRRHAQLHRDGTVILGPKTSTRGAKGSTRPRQTSA